MLLRTLFLLCITFPLLSPSCSRDSEPTVTPGEGTHRTTATGGIAFNNVRGTTHATYKTHIYQGVPGTAGYARNGQPTTTLKIRLNAPGTQWHNLFMSVTNYNSNNVADRTYHWTPIDNRGGDPEPLRDENVDCRLELTNGPEYWELDFGQIEFEYYGAHRVKGTFSFQMIHMFYSRIEPDASKVCQLSGSFDTEYDI